MECPSHHSIVHSDITAGSILVRHHEAGVECPSTLVSYSILSHTGATKEKNDIYGTECPLQHVKICTGCIWVCDIEDTHR